MPYSNAQKLVIHVLWNKSCSLSMGRVKLSFKAVEQDGMLAALASLCTSGKTLRIKVSTNMYVRYMQHNMVTDNGYK